MKVELFDFELPRELIAARPANPRDSARLLHIADTCSDRQVSELPELLKRGDLLVLNDTRVIPARLFGRRGLANVEVTLIERLGPGRYDALARPAKRLRPGDLIRFADDFAATVEAREAGRVTLRFDLDDAAFSTALARHGSVPLPPYIARAEGADARDAEDYQTIFARHDGSVAAPTAGLHFTEALFDALERRGVGRTFVTLHVGLGTFLPVTAEDTATHVMHAEAAVLHPETAHRINGAVASGGRIVAVGSTSVRVLERAARDDGVVAPFSGPIDLFIVPGYRFKRVDLMMTNFHLPRSTLFMLVAAFGGLERMRRAYSRAIAARYRFYSYGDACLIEPERP